MSEDHPDLHWRAFWLAVLGANIALIGGIVASTMFERTALSPWFGAAVSVTTLIVGWALVRPRVQRDEFDKRIDQASAAHAGAFVVVFAVVQRLLFEVGIFTTPPVPALAFPGVFLFFQTLIAQLWRRSIARSDTAGQDLPF